MNEPSIKENLIKEALEKDVFLLKDIFAGEDAKTEVKSIKRKCDGFTAIGMKRNKENFIQWHVPNEKLIDNVHKLVDFKDVYISINSMLSPLRQIKNLRHLHAFWVDLDYYKIKRYKNKTSEEMIEILRKKKLFKDVEPSFFVDSGNGMYIFYLIESATVKALPIWQKIQSAFVKHFSKYGSDNLSADAVHVLRLAGTINSKTDRRSRFIFNSDKTFRFEKVKEPMKVYTISELSKVMLPALPYTKEEWDKIKNTKKMTKKIKLSKKEISLYNLHTLHFARLNDIQKLQEIRNGECKGIREVLCFLYRYYSCLFIKDPISALANVIDFNESFKEPLNEKEVIAATASAEKAYRLWEETFEEYMSLEENIAMSTFFRKKGCYIYSNKKLIKLLNISEEEMDSLSTIISTKIKNKRSKDYRNEWKKQNSKEKLRNDLGLTSRQQGKLDNLRAVLDLKEKKMKQKEIAAELKITQQAVSKLLREYKNNLIDKVILNALNINDKPKTYSKDEFNEVYDIRDIAK